MGAFLNELHPMCGTQLKFRPMSGASFVFRFTSNTSSPLSCLFSSSPVSLTHCQSTDVKGLLNELPDGHMEDQHVEFLTLDVLHGPTQRPIDTDTNALVFVCALRYKETYKAGGDYVPAAQQFQYQLILLDPVHKWDYTLIFDGRPSIETCHKHQRRFRKEDLVVINVSFIMMYVLICRWHFVKYTVSPTEANIHDGCCRQDNNKDLTVGIPVRRDSNEVIYDNRYVVIVHNWANEEYWSVNIDVIRSYCATCKVGDGMCYHRGLLLWIHYLYWDEERPTPKPANSSFCS